MDRRQRNAKFSILEIPFCLSYAASVPLLKSTVPFATISAGQVHCLLMILSLGTNSNTPVFSAAQPGNPRCLTQPQRSAPRPSMISCQVPAKIDDQTLGCRKPPARGRTSSLNYFAMRTARTQLPVRSHKGDALVMLELWGKGRQRRIVGL
jgi:hypothetical protein